MFGWKGKSGRKKFHTAIVLFSLGGWPLEDSNSQEADQVFVT